MKSIRLAAALAVAVIALGSCMGMGAIRSMPMEDIVFADVPDGTYRGTFKHSRWHYDLEATVFDGVLETVVVHDCANKTSVMMQSFNLKCIEEAQSHGSTSFDAVSGGTISTKAFQLALEDALTKAIAQNAFE